MLNAPEAEVVNPQFIPGLVSVIVPTYNRAHLLEQTLNSVLSQTYRPIEVIVVDNGSEDATSEVLRNAQVRAAEHDVNLRAMVQARRGACAARNVGILASRGEFIQFLDSDDILSQRKLELQVRFATSSSAALVYGPWRRDFRFLEDPDVADDEANPPPGSDFISAYLSGKYVACHALLWRRDTIQSVGLWREDLDAAEDGEYLLRSQFLKIPMLYCPNSWVYYRPPQEGGQNLSAAYTEASYASRSMVVESIVAHLTHTGNLDAYRKPLAKWFIGTALSAATRRPKMAHRYLVRARQLQPFASTGKQLVVCCLYTCHLAAAKLLGSDLSAAIFDRIRNRVKGVLFS